jgi:hypothetical protein
MKECPVALMRRLEIREKLQPVTVAVENILSFVPSCGNVIERPGIEKTQRSCHCPTSLISFQSFKNNIRAYQCVNCVDLPLTFFSAVKTSGTRLPEGAGCRGKGNRGSLEAGFIFRSLTGHFRAGKKVNSGLGVVEIALSIIET